MSALSGWIADVFKKLGNWEREARAYYNSDLSTAENRRRAEIYNLWFDHAFLRTFWTNFYPVAPGVYRSNQPTHARFVKLKAMGIRTVLNLRGKTASAHYLVEEESCRKLGLTLVSCKLHARYAAPRADILAVIDAFRTIEKPFVMHCKSGADRAGFASVLYLVVMEGRPVAEARKMLSLRYVHLKWSRTGILGFILDTYEAHNAQSPISFEEWVRTEYENEDVQARFDASRQRKRHSTVPQT